MAISRFPDQSSSRPLGKPLELHFSKRTVKNRLVKAAMSEGLATWDPKDVGARGIPSKELIELYRRWGEGENSWGMIISGNVMVVPDTAVAGGEPIVPIDAKFEGPRFEAFKEMAEAGKANGSLMIAQLSHPGRQMPSKFAKEALAPSAVQLEPTMGMTFATTRAATESQISTIVASFAHSAAYVEAAGFDGIELHAAHGYLLAQFLSKTTNLRTDKYGGSLANRARILVEIIAAIRAKVQPSFIISAKLNSVEFQESGFTPQEAAELVRILQEEAKLDFVELSGGTYEKMLLQWTGEEKESTRKREAFFLQFAELIVPALGPERQTKVFITGGLRSVGAMVRALEVVDAVGLGRPSAQEPRLARDILEGRVLGAIKPVAPFDNDAGMGMTAAGALIKQISKGEEPVDLSDEVIAGIVLQDVFAHFARVGADGAQAELVGSFDISAPARPYGTVQVY